MERTPVQGKIFVGGISVETNEETLTQHFSRYGEVVMSQVIKSRETDIGKGFGFITFADSSVLNQVFQNQHIILGRTVDVKLAVPKGESRQCERCSELQQIQRHDSERSRSNTKKIFVGGLPPQLLEEDFRTHFENFGRIEDAKIIFNRVTNKSRGFGFVTYVSEESVTIVLQQRFHMLKNKSVEVKRAEPKERRIMNASNFGPTNSSYEMWPMHNCNDIYWPNHTMVLDWTNPFNYLGTTGYIVPQPVPIMVPYFTPRYPVNCVGSMHNQVNGHGVSSTFAHISCGTECQNNHNNWGSHQEGNNQDDNNGDVGNASPPATASGKPLEEETDNGEKDHLVKNFQVNTEVNNSEKDHLVKISQVNIEANNGEKDHLVNTETNNDGKEHLVKNFQVNSEVNNSEKDHLVKISQVNIEANNGEKDHLVNIETNNDGKEHLVKIFQVNTEDET